MPHFHGGEFAGRLEAGGLDTRTHEPAALAAVAGSLFQDPETQVVMGTVRAELAFPLENRGLAPRPSRAGWRRRRSRSASRRCSTARPTSCPAASCSASRSAPRWPAGRALALLDEPTSQLDPVAGDELLGVLRRINEEWGTAVILAEHRLERCLSAADRVVALRDGAIACDADPRGFLAWAGEHAPELQTPGARLFALAGRTPPPVSVKDARRALAADGFEPAPAPRRAGPDAGAAAARRRRGSARCAAAAARARSGSRPSGSSTRAARPCCAASTSTSRPASGSR